GHQYATTVYLPVNENDHTKGKFDLEIKVGIAVAARMRAEGKEYFRLTEVSLGVETVEKYTGVWAQMAEPTSDWLKRTGRLGKNFRKFLKLSGPVSSLVAAGLDTVFQPESDEYIAISKLNVDMNKGFEMVSESLQSIVKTKISSLNLP
uniref:Uncharacterized protein n=1 Tax=Meloidogyne floridensis TaxID=298350 RepID=A0A915PFC2_9BILA